MLNYIRCKKLICPCSARTTFEGGNHEKATCYRPRPVPVRRDPRYGGRKHQGVCLLDGTGEPFPSPEPAGPPCHGRELHG